jgi:archaemetzincin
MSLISLIHQIPWHRKSVAAVAAILLSLGWTVRFILLSEPSATLFEDLKTSPHHKSGVEAISAQMQRLRPIAVPLGKPKPGEYRAAFGDREYGQSFASYLVARGQPDHQRSTTFALIRIGRLTETQSAILDDTTIFLEAFLGCHIDELPLIELDVLPSDAFRAMEGSRQIRSDYLLEQYVKRSASDRFLGTLGVTADDMYAGEGSYYLGGEASPTTRCGIVSIKRLGNPDQSPESKKSFRLRLLKIMTHEMGHILGITHCNAWSCGMQGSMSGEEARRQPVEFCPECLAKLFWTMDLQPQKRAKLLHKLAERWGLEPEARHWKRSLELLSEQ